MALKTFLTRKMTWHGVDHKCKIKRDSLANKLGYIAIAAHHQYVFMYHANTIVVNMDFIYYFK